MAGIGERVRIAQAGDGEILVRGDPVLAKGIPEWLALIPGNSLSEAAKPQPRR
jgi:hypothetical protein